MPNYQRYVYRGIPHERDGITPHYEAILDDDNRVMVFIARNADNGDAWEWIDQPEYPLKYGLAAYRLGMNLIVYAMAEGSARLGPLRAHLDHAPERVEP